MNSFGRIFRITLYGESHQKEVGVVIDGVIPGIDLNVEDFVVDLNRRKYGEIFSFATTSRKESDIPVIKSGLFNGKTTGAPLTISFENKNIDSKAYEYLKKTPRPGHADFTSFIKFKGFNDYRGGGCFSGRLTLPLVAAGVIAKKILKRFEEKININTIEINAKLIEIGGIKIEDNAIKRNGVENNEIKKKKIEDYKIKDNKKIEDLLFKIKKEGDSTGGIIKCTIKNLPAGLGEPFFDSFESVLSHMIFSIPGIKGIEFGAGFSIAKMKGSEANDEIIDINGKTKTNNSGGINGGLSNGNDITFKVAVKPASSISKEQNTINLETKEKTKIKVNGSHDTCFALRVPVVIEAAAAIVAVDFMMLNEIYK